MDASCEKYFWNSSSLFRYLETLVRGNSNSVSAILKTIRHSVLYKNKYFLKVRSVLLDPPSWILQIWVRIRVEQTQKPSVTEPFINPKTHFYSLSSPSLLPYRKCRKNSGFRNWFENVRNKSDLRFFSETCSVQSENCPKIIWNLSGWIRDLPGQRCQIRNESKTIRNFSAT